MRNTKVKFIGCFAKGYVHVREGMVLADRRGDIKRVGEEAKARDWA